MTDIDKQKQELREQAQVYKCRADIFKKIITLLNGFAELEDEFRTMVDSLQIDELNHMRKTAEDMEYSYRKTSEVAAKAAVSGDFMSEALKSLDEEIENL